MRRAFYFMGLVLAAIFLVANAVYGNVKPTPVDADAILDEFSKAMQGEESKKWSAEVSDANLAILSIVIISGSLEQVEGNVFNDSDMYHAVNNSIDIIKKSLATLEQSGNKNMLYIKTKIAGLVPLKYFLALTYDKAYNFTAADSTYRQTLQEVGQDFGTSSEEFVYFTTLFSERMQRKHKNYDKAIQLLLPALEPALHSADVSDSTACAFLVSLAKNYNLSGEHNNAKELALDAEKRANDHPSMLFEVNNLLGELYLMEGDVEKSQQCYEKAAKYAPSLSHFFAAGVNCANSLRKVGYHDRAEKTLNALEKYVDSYELTAEDFFNFYETKGLLYAYSDPAKSAEYFREAEKFINWIPYPLVARHILNSQVYPNSDNTFKVISALDRAEMFFNMLMGDDPLLINEIVLQKGHYLLKIKNYKMARLYLETLYARIIDSVPGDPQLIEVLKLLARLDEIEGEDIRRNFYLNSLLRNTKVHGETSEVYVDALGEMLNFILQMKDEEGAKLFLEKYRKLSPKSFETYCFDYRLKLVEGKTKEAEKALKKIKARFPEHRDEVNLMAQRLYAKQHSPLITQVAFDVFKDYKTKILRQLMFMSANERRNIDAELRSRRDEIISAIRFAPELTDLALEYSLFSKGLLFHTQNEITELTDTNESAKKELAVIKGMKADLAKAMFSSDKKLVTKLQGTIDSRERYLIDDFLDLATFKHRFDKYDAKNLTTGLSPDNILVDFVEYMEDGRKHLGCFVIKPEEPVKFIELGERDQLNFKSAYERIWTPIKPFLDANSMIYFSVDGSLNTLPIEFVKDKNGTLVGEKYELHRVFHLADIVERGGIGEQLVAIGVSDHNSPIGQGESLDRGCMTDLPNVVYEIELIKGRVKPEQLSVLFNDDATEKNVKKLSGSDVSTLHFSTHGIYRTQKDMMTAATDSTSDDYHLAQRMLATDMDKLSGLILRQGNVSWKSPVVTEEEDDILTSEEIELMSFPNLRLTVLSACDSGLGEVDSDGVWGLQRAFRIAGSKSLICSLSKVDDYWTAQFMDAFYESAARGMSIYDSFQNAQKWLCSELPDEPEVWSSFILIE